MKLPFYAFGLFLLTLGLFGCQTRDQRSGALPDEGEGLRPRWTPSQAHAWAKKMGWSMGANFTPSYAVNQLEMWQAETFDPMAIDRELALAESAGFNALRVYLHDLLWQQDSLGFLERIDFFLGLADQRGIRTMFVLFDGVWDPVPKLGEQPAPVPGVHNSGWVQSPGAAYLTQPNRLDELKPYVQGVVGRFKNDQRVLAWDVFNEPENDNSQHYPETETPNKAEAVRPLVKKVFEWARAMAPSQPLTAAPWDFSYLDKGKIPPVYELMFNESDVISFHSYGGPEQLTRIIEALKAYDRPLLCTEYMARPSSTFQGALPIFFENRVSCFNWGLVAGKTQTIYPWNSWKQAYTEEPDPWFHDVFRPDGTAYNELELELLRDYAQKAKEAREREALLPH